MPLDETDHLLLDRIRRGDAEAWEQFIERFEGRLIAFARSRLGNETSAEDVVQETFAGFLVSLPNYDADTPLDSFLFSITAHKLTDLLRRQGRRPALSLFTPGDASEAPEPAGPGRKASSLARSRERSDAEQTVLADTLQKLIRQWKQRGELERLQAVELLFVLGWPNKDVAHRLGISEQSVANHKQFVVNKLKEAARAAGLRHFDLADVGVRPEASSSET